LKINKDFSHNNLKQSKNADAKDNPYKPKEEGALIIENLNS
jgi:hypothetical protein